MLSSVCLKYFQCCALPGRHRENVACLSGTWPSEETKAATLCVRGRQTWFLEAPLCVCLCRCAVPGSRRSTMVVLCGRCLLDQQRARRRSAWFTASCQQRWHRNLIYSLAEILTSRVHLSEHYKGYFWGDADAHRVGCGLFTLATPSAVY